MKKASQEVWSGFVTSSEDGKLNRVFDRRGRILARVAGIMEALDGTDGRVWSGTPVGEAGWGVSMTAP